MKQIYLMTIVFAMATTFNVTAQERLAGNTSDFNPESVQQPGLKHGSNLPTTQALWDIKFNYDLTAAVGSAGNAGVGYTGTEFWVSRWQNDTIYTLSPTGVLTSAFTIPGVTGVRSFTWDGQNLYAGKATATISVIDPMTKTQTGTITVSGGYIARHITYDSTANSGAGGFWIGDFSTPLRQIDMSGNVLNTIPLATHGLSGMYGSAIDHWTAGAPYLWVFYQGGGASDPQRIARLQLPSGTPTGVFHNVMSDVGAAVTGGLAGGLFITNQLDTVRTIVGVLQGTPNRLFGYELNDFILPAVDAALDTLRANVPFYQIPLVHTLPMNFTGRVRNAGANPISGTLNVDVNLGATSVYNATPPYANLSAGTAANVTTVGLYTPATTGQYAVTGVVSTPNDASSANDSLEFTFIVTDTVFARETDLVASSSLGIGTGTGGLLGQWFGTTIADVATSVSFYLNSPTAGDTVSAGIYNFAGQPGAVIATTPQYIIQAADTNGTWIHLPFTSGPVNLNPDNYFVGVREYSENVTLGTTTTNYRPAAGWVNIAPAMTWNPTEFYGFQRTYLLRLNVEGINTGINELNANAIVNIYPNPSTGKVIINSLKPVQRISVSNVLGEIIYSGNSPANSSLDLSGFNSGIYFIKVEGENFQYSHKVLIKKEN